MKKFLHYLYYLFLTRTQKNIKQQRQNPLSIPVLIINYNQLHFLQKQVDFYIKRGFSNIIIVDNNSSYPPLLEYYKEIRNLVTLEYMDKNYGHMVFFDNKKLYQKYAAGYYIISDADIIPNEALPEDFLHKMIYLIDKYFLTITKVGFALRIDDIPDHYILKDKVISWENNFWEEEVEQDIFRAEIDTTFALYKPHYPEKFHINSFYRALRISGDFTAQHGGWYTDSKNPTNEQLFYFKTSSTSASWQHNDEGEITHQQSNIRYTNE